MIISLTGPSGIGKGYIKEKIKEVWPFIKELTWITTRPLRSGELNYNGNRKPVSIEEFDRLQGNCELVLSQMLYGYCYGLRKSDLPRQKGIFYLTEFHIDNLLKASEWGLDIFSIALVPSNISFLQERLERYRGTERQEEINMRLESAKEELRCIHTNLPVFSLLINVSKNNESTLSSMVIEALKPILNLGEKR